MTTLYPSKELKRQKSNCGLKPYEYESDLIECQMTLEWRSIDKDVLESSVCYKCKLRRS